MFAGNDLLSPGNAQLYRFHRICIVVIPAEAKIEISRDKVVLIYEGSQASIRAKQVSRIVGCRIVGDMKTIFFHLYPTFV